MDDLVISCPACGTALAWRPEQAGSQAECGECGTRIQLPDVPPAAEGPQVAPDVVRANRRLAGAPCAACGQEILLGEEVVQCGDCGAVSHAKCWQDGPGCPRCAGPQAAAAPAPVAPAVTKACPACAEQIPVGAAVCPYCSEPVGVDGLSLAGAPRQFDAKRGLFGKRWAFRIGPEGLVGDVPGGGREFIIPREQAGRDITLQKRKMIITTGGKRMKFAIDDVGYVAVDSWRMGHLVPRVCTRATDALTEAIVGIFCFQIILGPASIVHALQARKMIRDYPVALSGDGRAIAGLVIGIMDVSMFGLFVVAQVIAATQ